MSVSSGKVNSCLLTRFWSPRGTLELFGIFKYPSSSIGLGSGLGWWHRPSGPVTSDKLPNFSDPQFLYLLSEENNAHQRVMSTKEGHACETSGQCLPGPWEVPRMPQLFLLSLY